MGQGSSVTVNVTMEDADGKDTPLEVIVECKILGCILESNGDKQSRIVITGKASQVNAYVL